jgi:hypothetical protein
MHKLGSHKTKTKKKKNIVANSIKISRRILFGRRHESKSENIQKQSDMESIIHLHTLQQTKSFNSSGESTDNFLERSARL